MIMPRRFNSDYIWPDPEGDLIDYDDYTLLATKLEATKELFRFQVEELQEKLENSEKNNEELRQLLTRISDEQYGFAHTEDLVPMLTRIFDIVHKGIENETK